MPPAFKLNQEMPVEVMKDFDTVLLFGRLMANSPAGLTIERILEEKPFPICQTEEPVLIRGYDIQLAPVLLLGKVIYSSGFQCVVGDLKRIPYETQRKSTRYPLFPPVSAYALDSAAPERPQPCQLFNISADGACIVAEQPYQVGQALRLQVQPGQEPGCAASYRCRVVRATPRRGKQFEYGLLFTEMDESGRSGLTRDIQSIREKAGEKLHV